MIITFITTLNATFLIYIFVLSLCDCAIDSCPTNILLLVGGGFLAQILFVTSTLRKDRLKIHLITKVLSARSEIVRLNIQLINDNVLIRKLSDRCRPFNALRDDLLASSHLFLRDSSERLRSLRINLHARLSHLYLSLNIGWLSDRLVVVEIFFCINLTVFIKLRRYYHLFASDRVIVFDCCLSCTSGNKPTF